MAFVTANYFSDFARGSNDKAANNAANAALVYALSRILTSGAVARGTTAAKVKTAADATFMVGGVLYALATTDDFWTLAGTVVAVSSWQKYLLMVDTSGTASIAEGTQSKVNAAGVVWTNLGGNTKWDAFLTSVGSTKAVLAVLQIATDATHTFTPGTTALNATGITATIVNGLDQSILPLIGSPSGVVIGQI